MNADRTVRSAEISVVVPAPVGHVAAGRAAWTARATYGRCQTVSKRPPRSASVLESYGAEYITLGRAAATRERALDADAIGRDVDAAAAAFARSRIETFFDRHLR